MERFNQIMKENDECIERYISEGRARQIILDTCFDYPTGRSWTVPSGYITKLYVTSDCERLSIHVKGVGRLFAWENTNQGKDEEVHQTKIIENGRMGKVEFIETALPYGYICSHDSVQIFSYSQGMREMVGIEFIDIEFYDDADNFISCRVNDKYVIIDRNFYASREIRPCKIFDDETLEREESANGMVTFVSIKDQIFEDDE